MAENSKHPIELFTVALKDLVSALRDSVLFLVFVLLLVKPELVKQRLTSAGFTGGTIGGLEWKSQAKTLEENTKSVGQTVDQASQNYSQLIERLGNLEKKVVDPQIKSEVQQLSAVAESSQQKLVLADKNIRSSLAVQQKVIAEISPNTIKSTGWIFLGKVSEDKKTWVNGSPATIHNTTTDLGTGTAVTIKDDVYLRADSAPNARASAAIIGALKVGDDVTINALDYSHAKSGGWFVWANIQK